jgi:hypothetical protein
MSSSRQAEEPVEADDSRKYGVAVGYALTSLAAPAALFEDENKASVDDWVLFYGGKATSSVTKPAGFPSVTLSAEQPLPGRPFGVVGRLGLLIPGSLKSEFSGTGAAGETEKQTESMDFTFYSIEVGAFARYRLPGGIWLRGNVLIGYAAMSMDYVYEYTYKDSSFNFSTKGTIPMSGSTITFAGEAEADYNLGSRWTVFAQLGYMMADVTKALTTSDVDANGDGRIDVKASYGFVDKHGKQIAYDFSGAQVRFGIKYAH